MSRLGIDFGTTNSVAVAYDKSKDQFTYFNFEDGQPAPISSTIEFHDNKVVVGNIARERMARFADNEGLEKTIKLQYQPVLDCFHLEDAGMVLVRNVKDIGDIRGNGHPAPH